MTKFITRTVYIVFALLLVVMLFAMSISLAEAVFSGWIAVFSGVAILMALFLLLLCAKKKIRSLCTSLYKTLSAISPFKLALFLGLVSAITKCVFVFLFDNNADLHPDMAMYRSFAEQYATQGNISENAGYACRFTYTAIYGFILSPLAMLFGSDTKVFTVALSILHSVAIVLLFDILEKYVGKEISFSVLFAYCMLPMGLFQTQLLTHENGLLFLHVVSLWLFLKAFDKRRHIVRQIGYILLASAILAIGKSINAAGQVFFISFGIYAVAKAFENGITIKKFTCLIGVFLALSFTFVSASHAVTAIKLSTIDGGAISESDSRKLPYSWPIYLGLNYESSGTWNREDADMYLKYQEFKDVQEAHSYQKNLIRDRVQLYIHSPIKIPVHLFNKIKVLWGIQILPFAYELGNSLNDFVLHGAGGIIYKGVYLVDSGMFLLLYTMILLGVFVNVKKKNIVLTPVVHCMMTVIGVTLALVLFEVTPKYVSHLHIMLFCVLAFVIKDFFTINLKTGSR